ncbi:MAG: hypothetical protein JO212_09715 [Acetobacteraceae bacterium]|nr:hypothetical protein [Acetobacteraceae bacterium]
MAAAIGRNFSLDLLYGVWDGVASKLRAGINSLLNAELIFQQTPNSCADPANTIFEFIHELVRETAYQSLLRSRRREIHRRIAQILEKRFPNEVARHPELLAHHLSEAGLPQQALPLWRLAAHNAVRNSANLEAIGHLSRALEIVRTQSLTPATKAQELELQMSLATPLMAAKGYGSPELDAVIRRAMALVEEIGNVPQIFPLLYGRWSFYQVTGELRNALELAQDFVNLAERQTDTGPVIVGQRLLGTSFQALGHPKLSLVHVERALAVFDADRHSSLAYSYGADIKVMALCTLALTKWTLGMEASARSRMHEAWQRAESLGHANTLAYCSSYRATLGYLCGEVEVVESASEFSTFLSAEHSLPLWQVTAKGFQGWTQLSRGDPAGAARMLRETLTSMQQIKLIYWQATVWMWFGQALDGAGHFDDAEAAFVHSHEIMEHTGERWAEAELFRAWGCARLHAGRTDAESLFQTSLNIAQEQNAIAWSLRTTLEMAQQASCAGDDVHARDLLRPILATLPDSEGGADFARARLIMNGARSSRNWHVITKHESASL